MVGASFIRSPADDWQTGLSIFASSVVNQGITTEWGTVERMRGGADASLLNNSQLRESMEGQMAHFS